MKLSSAIVSSSFRQAKNWSYVKPYLFGTNATVKALYWAQEGQLIRPLKVLQNAHSPAAPFKHFYLDGASERTGERLNKVSECSVRVGCAASIIKKLFHPQEPRPSLQEQGTTQHPGLNPQLETNRAS